MLLLKEGKRVGVKGAGGILKTLLFFSIFDLPVKKNDLRRFSLQKLHELEFEREFARLKNENKIFERKGLCFLKRKCLKKEQKRRETRKRLFKKALRASRFLTKIPYVRLVAAANSLAFGNVNQSSDIDLFIITEKDRLYLTRMLSILTLKAARLYQSKTDQAGKVSLGFLVDEDGLSIKKIGLKKSDPYLYFWLATLKPLAGENYYFQKFMEKNSWIKQELPNFQRDFYLGTKATGRQKFWEMIIPGFVANLLESLARRLQQRRIKKLPENSWPTSTTIVKKNLLKLHALDRRAEFRDKYLEKLKKIEYETIRRQKIY